MMKRKTEKERADEAAQVFLDWLHGGGWKREEEEFVLGGLIFDTITKAQKRTSFRIQLGSERKKPLAFVEFARFPFFDHRTLAEVMKSGDAA